jgi:hypothetical protein
LLGSQASLLHIHQYQHDRLNMLDTLERLEEAERQEKFKTVMEWVLGAETNLDHKSACDARHECPGSGSWLLKNPELENWKTADTPISAILWLKGIPGAGMSAIATETSGLNLYACSL